ncbi:DUF302 domain-containing protein [Candidatus Neomarinimicrobiota bacterium]
MSYYITKTINENFTKTVAIVTEELKKEGFGVLSEIDVKSTLKNKLDVDFRNYRILGACNPPFAYKALQIEEHVGTMLPCNVVIQEKENEQTEIFAVDPVASMQAIDNPLLLEISKAIQNKLKKVINNIN